ncbi:MAG: ABC transporter permease subunit [Anaerolineae bacterium]|nr:ABC transporter permease subunit [Anaerolineae bacterium]
MGLAGGALLLGATAAIGNLAALPTLLTPVVAAVLGGEVAVLIYRRVLRVPPRDKRQAQQAIRWGAFAVGAAVAFAVTFSALNLSRSVIDGRLPSSATWDLGVISVQAYLGTAALIGAVIGAVGGGLAGTYAAFPVGMTIYNTTRTTLNALRSIEPLIMGIVFVIWVGIGPFAGVLALTLHSIAALGKLYSEQIESIDSGPLEAITATGANRVQTIVYAVVPQIVPPYIAFTMYRWDINVRMSTIIGFVGGGGIGFLLNQQINLLRYREAGVAVLAIAIVVSVLDYASATIRERMI